MTKSKPESKLLKLILNVVKVCDCVTWTYTHGE